MTSRSSFRRTSPTFYYRQHVSWLEHPVNEQPQQAGRGLGDKERHRMTVHLTILRAADMAARWHAAQRRKGVTVRPLKLGIEDDIYARSGRAPPGLSSARFDFALCSQCFLGAALQGPGLALAFGF
jgi:hypothetical protein